jgi:hypothetical protein
VSILDIFNGVIVAPLVETLLFLLAYWVLHPRREFGPRTAIFILLMGLPASSSTEPPCWQSTGYCPSRSSLGYSPGGPNATAWLTPLR